tara:strand:- start:608 stop:805 length:198 start_codon:yes stop_codon:yes gene_type:complete
MNKINKDKSVIKIKDEIIALKKSLLNYKFQKSTGQLEKTSEIKKARRNIAKLKTQLTNKIGENNA